MEEAPERFDTLEPLTPEALLAGPRGRRLCWEQLVRTGAWAGRTPPARMAGAGGWEGAPLAREIVGAVARADLRPLAVTRATDSLLAALADSVTWASYWQEPDEWDRRLCDRAVAEALGPVAEAICRAPASAWWAQPLAGANQYEVRYVHPRHPVCEAVPTDGRGPLQRWRERTHAAEARAREQADDLRAPITGEWWSTPAGCPLRRSTRSIGTRGPVGLHLVEDFPGIVAADVWPLGVREGARVYEIDTPEAWRALVVGASISVRNSRRQDWWRATGQDADWLIPDYARLAERYDALHLTVSGYLSTAGRALPAGAGHTVLAGWDPDQTLWLTVAPDRVGPAIRWEDTGEPEPFRWTPAAEAGAGTSR